MFIPSNQKPISTNQVIKHMEEREKLQHYFFKFPQNSTKIINNNLIFDKMKHVHYE